MGGAVGVAQEVDLEEVYMFAGCTCMYICAIKFALPQLN